jgi:hypothetical protein
MARKAAKLPKLPRAASSGPSLVSIALKTILTLAIGFALIAGLMLAGQRAGNSVADQPRYAVPIAGIQCPAPPGTERIAFLAEVRSLGALPESVSAVDAETPPKLAAAFQKHPWVAEVSRVHVADDRTIHVDLKFRTPVLAVQISNESTLRLLDKSGILLPPSPVPAGITTLIGSTIHTPETVGQAVTDATARRAAELAELLKDRSPRTIERTGSGWRVMPATGPALLVGW